jgi:5-methylcytosine-specific restriction endonuclease McrA
MKCMGCGVSVVRRRLCKKCYNASWRLAHPGYFEVKQAERYYGDLEGQRRRTRDWESRNPDKVAAFRKRAWANKDKGQARIAHREWCAKNRDKRRVSDARRRAKIAGGLGDHTEAEWVAVKNKFGNRCAECGVRGALEKDHIVPLYLGGSNLALNLQPLCKSCNCRKGKRLLVAQVSLFDQTVPKAQKKPASNGRA